MNALEHIDRVLRVPDYDVHSRSHVGDKDLQAAVAWLDRREPLFDLLLRLRNQRITRRKEFYEVLFTLKRLTPELRRARSLCELSGGHGLLGLFAALLFPNLCEIAIVDRREPLCFDRARELFAAPYPFVKTRTRFFHASLSELGAVPAGAFVVGVHCCGGLTDDVARIARAAGAPFAVVPCCEGRMLLEAAERRTTPGAVIPAIVNTRRVGRWERWGYRIEERWLPKAVTERSRLFVGTPVSLTVPKEGAPVGSVPAGGVA